jgi:hypothetical protein
MRFDITRSREPDQLPVIFKETAMSEKLEGSKTFEVPVQGGFNRKIEVNANSFKEATQKVSDAGHKLDPYRFGREK